MSIDKEKKIDGRGGARPGSGRPKNSGEKRQICVSVHGNNWNTALERWKPRKPSWLVDKLILSYVKRGQAVLDMGAA